MAPIDWLNDSFVFESACENLRKIGSNFEQLDLNVMPSNKIFESWEVLELLRCKETILESMVPVVKSGRSCGKSTTLSI